MDNKKYIRNLKFYYLLTPVFVIFDFGIDFNIRLAIPGEPVEVTAIYYLVCFIASFIVFKSTLGAMLFSLAESSINILLLILSVFLPIITLPQNVESNFINDFIFGVNDVIHFMLVAGVLLYGFYSNPLLTRNR